MLQVPHRPGDYAGPRLRAHLLDERIRRGDCPTARALAGHVGVSTRTLHRDLDYLRYSLHAPLAYDAERGGWSYTQPGFFLPLVFADGDDFQALLILGQALAQYAGTPLGARLEAAYHKLLALFKGADSPALRRFVGRFRFASAPGAPTSGPVWAALFVALQREQCLRIEYRKRGQGPAVARVLEPWGVIVRGRDWFVHGYCRLRRRPLTFYLPWIRSARLAPGEHFEVPAEFDLTAYTREGFQALQAAGARARRVVLRFAPERAGVAAAVPFAHRQRVTREADGCVRVEFRTNALFQVEREVLSWGAAVEVLEPEELRTRVAEAAREMARRYGKGVAARGRRAVGRGAR